ncbi:hypothetical protein [Carboxylicivirga taeanensis]|uniref:hypothetical protein n=1 Tax=Carboxylicivirga taeanensis TaxID=1416875 RepID=UPI003F6DC40F
MPTRTILLKLCILLITLLFISCEKKDDLSSFEEDLIEVITLEATEVSLNSAYLNGKISDIGNKETGFEYADNVEFENSKIITVSESDIKELSFAKIILNLQPNQEYYYKAYYNAEYGDVKTFKTFDYPKVIINEISLKDKNTINIQGSTSSDILLLEYQIGFYFFSNKDNKQEVTVDVPTEDGFEIELDNLLFNSNYSIVPFVQIGENKNYQDTISFSTLSNFIISYVDSVDISAADSPIIIPQTTNSKLSQNCYLDAIPEFSNGFVLSSLRTEIPSNVLFAGHNNNDAKVINMDVMSKSIAWEYSFGGSDYEWIEDICIVDDGYLVLGLTYSDNEDFSFKNNESSDFFLLKLDNNGNQQWIKAYGTLKNDYPQKIIANSSDSFYLVGNSFSNNNESEINSSSSYLIEVNNQGEIIKETFYPILNGSNIITVLGSVSGDLFIGGTAHSETGNGIGSDKYLASLSQVSDNNVIWSAFLDGSDYDNISYIFESDNKLIVLGQTNSKSGDFVSNNVGGSPWIALVNLDGTIIESYIISPNSDSDLKDAKVINDQLMLIFKDKTKEKVYKVEVAF